MHQIPLDGQVPTVVRIVLVRHAHLLTPKKGSRFQHTVYLGERAFLVWRMARRFDRVAPVKRAVFDGAHVHEAARDAIDHMAEPRFGVERFRPIQLDFIVIDPDNPDTGLTGDTAHRAANPTTDIDHRHALPQFQLSDHQPLMPDLGFLQALPRR